MASAIALGAKALFDQVQTAGQIVEIAQSHVHQREQVHWTKRGFHLDSQSLRLDALDHAKEEIRSHYDTYVGRIDTLLLVLALIWPFALNTIQFSDPFVPQTAEECPDCVEATHKWLITWWVTLMALILILPFWGILMLIRAKLQLDNWLEYSLGKLNRERRGIVQKSQPQKSSDEPWGQRAREEMQRQDDETERIVYRLVDIVLEYQEYLANIWTAECSWLVHGATMFLWVSAVMALMMTSLSVWIFLVNRSSVTSDSSGIFAMIIGGGLTGPAVYFFVQQVFGVPVEAPDSVSSHPNSPYADNVSGPLARCSVNRNGDGGSPRVDRAYKSSGGASSPLLSAKAQDRQDMEDLSPTRAVRGRKQRMRTFLNGRVWFMTLCPRRGFACDESDDP